MFERGPRTTRRHASAASVLKTEAHRRNDRNLFHHLAALYVRCLDRLSDAAVTYQSHLIDDEARKGQMLTEYASILCALGRRQDAIEIWQSVVHLPLPATSGEFYFRGFAHYRLGNETTR
jgi:hypothetical protein